jgi:hypothetical protein
VVDPCCLWQRDEVCLPTQVVTYKEADMSFELSERRIVTMTGDGEPTKMEVYLELDVDDHSYGLLIPMDLPVHLVRAIKEGDSDVLDPVDAKEAQGLLGELNNAIRDWGMKGEAREDGIFLVGDPNDEFLEDCDIIEVRADDDEEEEYAVLVELQTGDANYLVITPMVPDLYPVEFTGTDGARLLDDEELGDLEETFQAALSAIEDEE